MIHPDGFYGMGCWNGLSEAQQRRLVTVGNLPMGYRFEGPCRNGADCSIETLDDEAPGPRFYCYPCAVSYLEDRTRAALKRDRTPAAESDDLPQTTAYPVTKW